MQQQDAALPHATIQAEILIVGAGLTGLSLADALIGAGRNVLVIEGRARIGGRILTRTVAGAAVDLGPAWIWPGQPRVAALAAEFGLQVFDQHATGRLVFEAADGAVRRDLDMAPMAGALRIVGGLGALTAGLAARVGGDAIRIGHRLTALASADDGISAKVEAEAPLAIKARHVILAAPPRLLEDSFDFTPHLPEAARRAMRATPTWMAGHAKVVALYPRPFWRDAGLNGSAISHRGPLAEIHDASPGDGSVGALFGFVGLPAKQRLDRDRLMAAAKTQLVSLFGSEASASSGMALQDWAAEGLTATRDDQTPPTGHPAYGPIQSLEGLWSGRLHIASSETAPAFGGLIEGALEAAATVAARVLAR